MIELLQFLSKRHQASTVKIYHFEIQKYLDSMGESQAQNADHKTVLKYVTYLRKRYENPGSIHRIIQAIKQYYTYLISEKIREDHPCKNLIIKDKIKHQVQLQDLLTRIELQALLERKERYKVLELRNKVIISLLVYQGLLVGEIVRLKVQDIDLEKGLIKVQSTSKTNARTLALQAEQILVFYKYIHEVRPQLLKQKTSSLVLTKKGTEEKGEGIHYLVQTHQKQFPNKHLTPTKIRQSVIALMLKEGKDLRIVQAFAGHKKPSTTEKYRATGLEELQAAIQKYHPLNNL